MFTRIKGAATGVLPRIFGNDFLRVEQMIYSVASKVTENSDEPYSGGTWHFMEDKDAGVEFVAILQDDPDRVYEVFNPGNQDTVKMSAEAFSIAVTNIVLNNMLWYWYQQWERSKQDKDERKAKLYDQLWRQVNDVVMYNHDECAKIKRAID